MRPILSFIILVTCCIYLSSYGQNGPTSDSSKEHGKNLHFQLRIPFQVDFPKIPVQTPFGEVINKPVDLNFGIDGLVNFHHTNFSAYAGLGYYRNRISVKREYDHRMLNLYDSFPIGTVTHHYTYHLVRLPVGISFPIVRKGKMNFGLGIEHIFNFTFHQVYNGSLAFAGAKNSSSKFMYFGNSILLVLYLSWQPKKQTSILVRPYLRLANWHKQDPVLKDRGSQKHYGNFDAAGLLLIYSLK